MTALITGASGGIGEHLARVFAAHKHDLVLVARSADRLDALSTELSRAFAINSRVLTADLTDPAAPPQIFETLRGQGITIDALVNNAGFGACGPYAQIDYQTEARMLQLNVAALMHLTRLFLPGMIERRSGKIMNVASTAAFLPGPLMAVYYASKAFVLSFTEALAEETHGTGVIVSALCPGPTQTNFATTAGNADSVLFRSAKPMSPFAVARVGYEGMMKGKRVVVPGWTNQVSVFSTRLAPRTMLAKIARKLNT